MIDRSQEGIQRIAWVRQIYFLLSNKELLAKFIDVICGEYLPTQVIKKLGSKTGLTQSMNA